MKRMKRTIRLISVAAVVVLIWAAQSCNFAAGLKTGGGAGAGAAGTTNLAGASGAAGMAGAGGMTSGPGTGGAALVGGDADAGMTMPTSACTNLACQQSTCRTGNCTVPACANGGRTTVSGKIYDPAGKVPLYNITVYVPNGTLADIKDGPTCDPCDPKTGTSLLSGDPIVVTKTDETGTFHLGMMGTTDVPAGTSIPLVIQDGKWRRQIMVPTVTACMDTMLTDVNQTRLPQTQAEGHIPKMALTTGESDAMECLLRKIGISDMEFTPETGTGRVNLYQGGDGAAAYAPTLNGGMPFTAAAPWWEDYDNNLAKYDIILHSCDGGQGSYNPAMAQEPAYPKSMAARAAMQKFADNGGRVFASHWHAYWFEEGSPAFQSIATWEHDPGLPQMYVSTIDQTFDKGKSLAQWMLNVGGSTTLGMVEIDQTASTRIIKAAAGGKISQRWIYASTLDPPSLQFLSATTPVPGGSCGRVVISDLHVSAGTGMNTDQPKMPFPTGCITTELSPREKALEFMFFDIASCVQPIVQ